MSLCAPIETSLARLARAHDEALGLALPDELATYDPGSIALELDLWRRTPPKIAAATTLGRLHVAVYWDQTFALDVFPRGLFHSVAHVLAYHRRAALEERHRHAPAAWRQLFGHRGALEPALATQRTLFERFVAQHPSTVIDGALYVDLADVLRGGACHWTGHWTFDGTLLDRYADGRIDCAHYFTQHFHTGDAYERFARFADELQRAGMTREKTWSLFTPSGERTFRLAAVYALDGNCDALLLEGADEFVEVRAMGS